MSRGPLTISFYLLYRCVRPHCIGIWYMNSFIDCSIYGLEQLSIGSLYALSIGGYVINSGTG
jgi:hypothetical protein